MRTIVVLAVLLCVSALAGQKARATIPLGLTELTKSCTEIRSEGMIWTRIIADSNADSAAISQRIRDCHEAGLKIVLTVGGIGTNDRFNVSPGFERSIAFINRLPRVEYVSIDNEPDLDGIAACDYYRGWKKARRIFGKRLLFGEFSPHAPLTFIQAIVNRCGKLAKRLWVSIHPYQRTDPLAPPRIGDPWEEGGIGNLGKGRRWLKKNTGITVRWVPTEFGFCTRIFDRHMEMDDETAQRLAPRAIKRFNQLRVPFAIIYVADGPTWRSSPWR